MKISDLSNNRMPYVSQAKASNQSEKTPPPSEAKESPSSGDRVDLSVRSKEMQRIYEVLQTAPEVREDKVARYKRLIEEGKYQVAPEDVADRMLKESLLDLL